jgi:hypothetical protein
MSELKSLPYYFYTYLMAIDKMQVDVGEYLKKLKTQVPSQLQALIGQFEHDYEKK